jgi:large subunit ribosomal protein L25
MNVNRIELSAEPRTALGKKVKALRRQGFVPANIYGHRDSTAIQIGVRDADHTIRRAGKTSLVTVNVAGGEPETVLIKQWQRHPYRGDVLHIDFYRVAMTERLRVDIPLRIVGEAPAIRTTGGMLFAPISTVTIESLPGDLPDAFEVDVSVLADLESAVHVRDLAIPDAVTLITDGDEVVARVLPATVEPEPTEEVAEGEAAAEAEGGAAEATATDEESSEES